MRMRSKSQAKHPEAAPPEVAGAEGGAQQTKRAERYSQRCDLDFDGQEFSKRSSRAPGSGFVRLNDLVVIARGTHPIPSRTRPLSPSAPIVLCLKAWESRTLPGLSNARRPESSLLTGPCTPTSRSNTLLLKRMRRGQPRRFSLSKRDPV